ncbi:hypothetical protein D3C76_619300 [compost metagenome]
MGLLRKARSVQAVDLGLPDTLAQVIGIDTQAAGDVLPFDAFGSEFVGEDQIGASEATVAAHAAILLAFMRSQTGW